MDYVEKIQAYIDKSSKYIIAVFKIIFMWTRIYKLIKADKRIKFEFVVNKLSLLTIHQRIKNLCKTKKPTCHKY